MNTLWLRGGTTTEVRGQRRHVEQRRQKGLNSTVCGESFQSENTEMFKRKYEKIISLIIFVISSIFFTLIFIISHQGNSGDNLKILLFSSSRTHQI